MYNVVIGGEEGPAGTEKPVNDLRPLGSLTSYSKSHMYSASALIFFFPIVARTYLQSY